MAKRLRRNHTPAFKAKGGPCSRRGEKAIVELRQQFDVPEPDQYAPIFNSGSRKPGRSTGLYPNPDYPCSLRGPIRASPISLSAAWSFAQQRGRPMTGKPW